MVSIASMAALSRRRFSVSVALLALSFCSASSGQDALQLFHKMQDALGGADKIASIRDFEENVRAQAWHNDGRSMGEVHKRTRWIRPNILRLDQVGAEDTYVLYFDGTSGWEILPDKPLANFDAGDLKFAHNYLVGIVLNRWLADRDPNRVITSSGPNVIVVSTKGDSSQKTEITLDPATSLPMKETGISLSDPNHPVTRETKLEQWRSVDGVQFPHLISTFQGGTQLAEIVVEQIKLNRGLKVADLSLKPRDQKPVMSQP
ncbi:MAG TPA: hypothetical protein VEK33_17050 [Terriglobales bacterium]|nr:hypothetical protein [Terriglobales bacterium]